MLAANKYVFSAIYNFCSTILLVVHFFLALRRPFLTPTKDRP